MIKKVSSFKNNGTEYGKISLPKEAVGRYVKVELLDKESEKLFIEAEKLEEVKLTQKTGRGE